MKDNADTFQNVLKMEAKRFLVLIGIAVVNGGSHKDASKNETFHVPDLGDICENLENATDINAKCKEQLTIVCGNLTLFTTSE